jgi:hypothetical protein
MPMETPRQPSGWDVPLGKKYFCFPWLQEILMPKDRGSEAFRFMAVPDIIRRPGGNGLTSGVLVK